MTLVFDKGAGFPSTCRELALRGTYRKDPNGYYSLLGLKPDASDLEIKKKCRKILAECHPDGPNPNFDRFHRVEEIYRILVNPHHRARYEHTPEGSVFVDSEVYRQFAEMLPRDFELPKREEPFWSYYADGYEQGDRALAQAWYRVLIPVLAELKPSGTVVLVLSRWATGRVVGQQIQVPRSNPTWRDAVEIATN